MRDFTLIHMIVRLFFRNRVTILQTLFSIIVAEDLSKRLYIS